MVYSSQNAAFRRDKQQFFSQHASYSKPDFSSIDQRVDNIGYTFLLKNQSALETEFNEMFTLLQNQDDENKEVFWLYCYYSASLLEAFYQAYSQEGNAQKYSKIKQQIKDRLNHDVKHEEVEEGFIHYLSNSFVESFRNLANAPFHLSRIRDYVAYSNLCRIYWIFCRLTLTKGLTLPQVLTLIEKLDVILGTHTDVQKIISAIQAPTFIINYFSVGFFLARFAIDGGLLLRHTFFPTAKEKGEENSCEVNKLSVFPDPVTLADYRNSYILIQNDKGNEVELYYIPKSGLIEELTIKDNKKLKKDLLDKINQEQSIRLSSQEIKDLITAQTGHIPEMTTRYDRFMHELYKRHCNFANDLVWATVNFLCNFNYLVNISDPTAGYLTAVFLAFDVGMTLYKCKLAKHEYLTKKAQYLQEIDDYNSPDRFKNMTDKQKLVHVQMLNQQLIALELDWRTKEATFYFVAAAAALLMMGFTASMLVNPAILVAGCYFACTIAVAMYLSAGSYSKFAEKSFSLEQAQLNGNNLPVSLKEYELARNDFIFTMSKNTVMPLLLISTAAIYWPAAIAITVMYVGYEIYHAYDQHSGANAIKKPGLNSSTDNEDNESLLLPAPSAC